MGAEGNQGGRQVVDDQDDQLAWDANDVGGKVDKAGNLTETIDADSNVTTFAYNADNELTSQTNYWGTATFAYNGLGLMTGATDNLVE